MARSDEVAKGSRGRLCRLLGLALAGLCTLLCIQVAAAQAVPAQTVATPAGENTYGSTLPVSPGDLVQIDVFGSPELSGRYRVSQNGDIDLLLGGPFHIAGQNSSEAAVHVEELLKEKQIVLRPHVNVFVREYASQGVTIFGEVKNPGIYPALGEHRLYDLIAAAGGFTAAASNRVTIMHPGGGPGQTIDLSNMALTDNQDDVPLGPGDRVVVSSGGIVYVIGDVGRPGGFVLSRTDSQLTVLKALSLAGGFNHTAKMGSATIMTQTPQGLVHKDFDLRKILQHKETDPVLAAGDVLYLPNSTAKVIGYRGLEAAFAATSSLALVLSTQ